MSSTRFCTSCQRFRLRLIVIGFGMVTPVSLLFFLLPKSLDIESAIFFAKWLSIPWFAFLYIVYLWLVTRATTESRLQDPYRLIFFSDENFFTQFALAGTSHHNSIIVSGVKQEKDATRLGFDFSTAVSFVAVVSGTMNIVVLATKFLDWLSPTSELIIQCPNGKSIKIIGSNKITAEQLADFIRLCHKSS